MKILWKVGAAFPLEIVPSITRFGSATKPNFYRMILFTRLKILYLLVIIFDYLSLFLSLFSCCFLRERNSPSEREYKNERKRDLKKWFYRWINKFKLDSLHSSQSYTHSYSSKNSRTLINKLWSLCVIFNHLINISLTYLIKEWKKEKWTFTFLHRNNRIEIKNYLWKQQLFH